MPSIFSDQNTTRFLAVTTGWPELQWMYILLTKHILILMLSISVKLKQAWMRITKLSLCCFQRRFEWKWKNELWHSNIRIRKFQHHESRKKDVVFVLFCFMLAIYNIRNNFSKIFNQEKVFRIKLLFSWLCYSWYYVSTCTIQQH